MRFEGCGRDGGGIKKCAKIGDGAMRFLAQDRVHGDERALLRLGMKDQSFDDGNTEHFFETEGLGAELDTVVEPLGFFARLVFDGAGFGDDAFGFFDLDDVSFAVEAEGVGPDGEGSEKFPACTVLEAREVGVLVVNIAEEGVFVGTTDAFVHFQSCPAFAIEQVVEEGEGDEFWGWWPWVHSRMKLGLGSGGSL